MYNRLTPVFIVAAIEPLLAFWLALGFEKTVEVPHGQRIGFVAFKSGPAEVMYQTVESVREDEGKVLQGAGKPGIAGIFIEVENLDAVAAKVPQGTEILVKRRTTFYGATEMIVRDPAGNAVIFAKMKPKA